MRKGIRNIPELILSNPYLYYSTQEPLLSRVWGMDRENLVFLTGIGGLRFIKKKSHTK